MCLDLSGALLEGIRVSEGNDSFTFPPRTLVTNSSTFGAITKRAEYVLISSSTTLGKQEAEIADADLRFQWTKNESTVIRFAYDGFSKRWLPSPGGPPDVLGPISNSPRLTAPVPDPSITNAPFALYIGSPVRALTFTIQLVGTVGDFSSPTSLPTGTVQLSKLDGKLNFSSLDISIYAGQSVLSLRQGFFDRTKSTGSIGKLPASSSVDYFLFMNPKPATTQFPRIRIDYSPLLIPIEVATESLLGSPISGTFTWSVDTGRVRFADADVNSGAGENIYYDGVTIGVTSPTRITLGAITASFPSSAFTLTSAIGATDFQRFVIFAELIGNPRNYFTVQLVTSASLPDRAPAAGTVYIGTDDGAVYFSDSDASDFSTWTVLYLDSIIPVENGISVQLYRSGVNGSGESQVADFKITYTVEEQIIVDGIGQTPFVMLPTTPLVDSFLKFSVEQGPSSSGTFTGELADGKNPSLPGLGYLLNLDQHQLKFSSRAISGITLKKTVSNIKLVDAAISELGFEATKNSFPIIPGVDFEFDSTTGVLSFVEPIGENDPANVSGIAGTASGSSFISSSPVFSSMDIGKFLLIQSGGNDGIYQITGFITSNQVVVSPSFISSGAATADLRQEAEIIADRFWTELKPPLKKFSLAVGTNPSGPFTPISQNDFNVFAHTGQVNLTIPALPGQVFQATYIALESPEEGVEPVSINKVELALFKIRQETATTAVGSSLATFNPSGKDVSTARSLDLFLNGVPLSSEGFEFTAPGTLKLANPVASGQTLILDYWVEEATGGETNFNLLSDAVDIDTPQIFVDNKSASFNGDQTGIISIGSAIFIGQIDILIVQSVSYDSLNDVTNVIFETAPVADSAGAAILATNQINGSYRIAETASVDVLAQGTNTLLLVGNISGYASGTIITIDDDPYSVVGAVYVSSSNRTKITLAAPASKNYVIPSVTKTVRPIFFSGTAFQTSRSADLSSLFTLVKMGSVRNVLVRDVDYTVAEGGIISLTAAISFGDSLFALYVAAQLQPVGTNFSLNYSHAIAPNPSNGIVGQRLLATYHLYAPDTFFYRVETIETFLPEVTDLLRQSAQSGGSSGPNTANATGQSNKDFGRASPFFDEQNLGNIDEVIIRLLKFYNDTVNSYEDILSDIDGRIVGGLSGRFRFDGNINNPPRDSYAAITNDIDDRIKLYDELVLTGFFTFTQVPVYATMAIPNSLSRIFPIAITKSAALNDKVTAADFGEVMGTLGVSDIKSALTMTSAQARAFFTSVSGSTYVIPKNGDETNLVPRFVSGQDVDVYSEDGVLAVSGSVVSATTTEPATIILSVPTSLRSGSLLQDVSDPANTLNHFYNPGRDLEVDTDNGQIINATVSPTLQNPVIGNEIIDAPLTFNNTDLKSKRVPVLDGLEFNDDGRLPAPLLKRSNESALLVLETQAFGSLGNAKVNADFITASSSTIPVTLGSTIKFIDGPNAGILKVVSSVISPASFQVSIPFSFVDSIGSNFLVTSSSLLITNVLNDEIDVLNDNVVAPVTPPSLLHGINSEVKSIDGLIPCYGTQITSGTGTTASNVLTDAGANFTLAGVIVGYLVYVQSGANRGLYRVTAATATTITVDTTSPWIAFPSAIPTSYIILEPLSFLKPSNFEFATKFFRDTLSFLTDTQTFLANPTAGGISARLSAVASRQSGLTVFVNQVKSLLIDDKLYEMRYLWLDQRANRKDGTLTKKVRAQQNRQDAIEKLIADQQKILIAEAL